MDDAEKEFYKSLKRDKYRVDQDKDGKLSACEKADSTSYMGR